MIIPYEQLSSEALNNLIESYILREGTDYGEIELSLAEKKQQLLHQIKQGEVVIVYSELHETVSLKKLSEFKLDKEHSDYR